MSNIKRTLDIFILNKEMNSSWMNPILMNRSDRARLTRDPLETLPHPRNKYKYYMVESATNKKIFEN